MSQTHVKTITRLLMGDNVGDDEMEQKKEAPHLTTLRGLVLSGLLAFF